MRAGRIIQQSWMGRVAAQAVQRQIISISAHTAHCVSKAAHCCHSTALCPPAKLASTPTQHPPKASASRWSQQGSCHMSIVNHPRQGAFYRPLPLWQHWYATWCGRLIKQRLCRRRCRCLRRCSCRCCCFRCCHCIRRSTWRQHSRCLDCGCCGLRPGWLATRVPVAAGGGDIFPPPAVLPPLLGRSGLQFKGTSSAVPEALVGHGASRCGCASHWLVNGCCEVGRAGPQREAGR